MNPHTFHFLNVKEGDCTIIEHGSGHVSMIDVCNARKEEKLLSAVESYFLQKSSEKTAAASGARKNYGQKAHPVNPISYLQDHSIYSLFRFVLTHPDMDHLAGC
jgi:beta-lactamase superfamily II metal-dependent hydrolase